MDTYKSHWPAVGILHEVRSDEVSSGIANMVFFNNPRAREMLFTVKVEDVSGVIKTDGFKSVYHSASGTVSILNDTSSLATGDIISVIGMRYV